MGFVFLYHKLILSVNKYALKSEQLFIDKKTLSDD